MQILDLRIDRRASWLRVGWRPARQVVRAVWLPSGRWSLFTADGALHDARLVGGWVLARGALVGLRWRTETELSLSAMTGIRRQAPGDGRRLLARLRWPLPEPAVPPGP